MGNDTVNDKEKILKQVRELLVSFEDLGDLGRVNIEELKETWTSQFDELIISIKSIEGYDHLQEFSDLKMQKVELESHINSFVESLETLKNNYELGLDRAFGILPAREQAASNIIINWETINTLNQVNDELNSLDEKIKEELQALNITDEEIFDIAKHSESLEIELSSLDRTSSVKDKFLRDVKQNLDEMFGNERVDQVPGREIRYFIAKSKSHSIASAFGIDYKDSDILVITAGINRSKVSAGSDGDEVDVPYSTQADYPAKRYVLLPESDTLKTAHSENVEFMKNGPKAKLVARIYLNVSSIRPTE